MLDLTANASVNGVRFDGVDLFLCDPHVSIDATDDEIRRLADRIRARQLVVGSLVAPVWPPTGGGSAMGDATERRQFVTQVRKACQIGKTLREIGIRHTGVVRIDSAASPAEWAKDPEGNTKKIAETFREACDVAESFGERLAAEGEICWGGMHSWKRNVELLEQVGRPQTLGFQADMAHTLLFTLGYNAPEDRLLPDAFAWNNPETLDEALKTMTQRAAAVDHRFSRRAERRDGEGIGIARQDRPPLSAQRSERQAGRGAARRLLDARRQRHADPRVRPHLLGRLHVSERHDDAARHLDERAQRR